MAHLLSNVSNKKLAAGFWLLLAPTILLAIVLNLINQPLITPAAPLGIVSFEVAGSPERARQMLASWDGQAQAYAAFSLGLDYLFMVIYSTTFALGCLAAGQVVQKNGWALGGLGLPLAWGQWGAAGMDMLENLALTLMLLEGVSEPLPWMALTSATIKFALLGAGLAYLLYGAAAHLLKNR